ncbi:MAG: transglycosylase SLT domain-containing protein, partial [Chloroflexota bacterium]|nr:transglycosylase SLT domain-containing protein [Chloroflexota bacterium]
MATRTMLIAVLLTLVAALPVSLSSGAPASAAPSSVLMAPNGIAVILGEWSEMLQQAAAESGVPWQVLAATMIVESGGKPEARSPTGAIGLMQLRPEHWQAYANVFGSDPWDPATNIRTGAAVLADANATWGSWELAVAAYVGAVDDAGAISSRLDDDGRTGIQYVDAVRNQAAGLSYFIPGSSQTGPQGAEKALRVAMTTLGTPYVWGGESYEEGGFDCSGLVLWAYNQAGATLPRTAAEQFNATTRIDPLSVKPGDLIFFVNTYGVDTDEGARIVTTEQRIITHNGIYAGNGMM